MSKEDLFYDQRQLRLIIKIIDEYESDVNVIENILMKINSLFSLLSLKDNKWKLEFEKLSNFIFEKNEWVIIALDKDGEFFSEKKKSFYEKDDEKDRDFIEKSFREIKDLFFILKKHIESKIDNSLTDEDVEYKF